VITLSIPTSQGGVYVDLYGTLVGPIGINSETEDIPLRLDTDSLVQGFGFYGENAVDHNKMEGHVTYRPLSSSITSASTPQYPFRETLNAFYSWSTSTPATVNLNYGSGLVGGGYAYSVESSGYTHKTGLSTGEGLYRLYTIVCPYSTPKRVTVSYVEMKNFKQNGWMLEWESRPVAMSLPPINTFENVEFSWDGPMSADAMWDVINMATPDSLGAFTKESTMYSYVAPTSIVSPSKMKADIIAFIVANANTGEDPNELLDYGELAMRATAKINDNPVNMVAFLRDIRKIHELVPKLQNFWKLKTLADNYLTVEYGILPTIDDLKSIYTALRGIKPYLDRNGFRVVTSAHTASSTRGNITFNLEQRIKVAVDEEDSGLLAIVNELDSKGFLLTFENLWDLVPYSFVIDWVLDIGSFLERVDANLRHLRLGIRYATLSWKRTADIQLVPTPDFPYSGTISQVQYHRWVQGHCPAPPLFSDVIPEDFDHWIEATALIIQRKSK